jgi:large subunit ribosomal protein L18
MNRAKERVLNRANRAARIRKKIEGTSERPRLCVRRSLNHIYAQIVDDLKGTTLVLVGSSGKDFAAKKSGNNKMTKSDVAKLVGEMVADKAKEKGIVKVVFDRKGYRYHGRVKALAESARAKGLVF